MLCSTTPDNILTAGSTRGLSQVAHNHLFVGSNPTPAIFMKNLYYTPVRVDNKNHKILFWGCLHYRHNPKWDIPIWKMRGFNSSEEHDLAIIERWNMKASDSTVGFLLGDTVFGYNAETALKDMIENRLMFKELYIMPGNHQAGWKQLFESCAGNIYYAAHGGKVVFVPNYLEAYVNGQPIVMSHYPILSWNGQGKGSWMLYSHVHGSLGRSELGRIYQANGRSREVSVEMAKEPLTFGELKSELERKPKWSPDHHAEAGSTPFS